MPLSSVSLVPTDRSKAWRASVPAVPCGDPRTPTRLSLRPDPAPGSAPGQGPLESRSFCVTWLGTGLPMDRRRRNAASDQEMRPRVEPRWGQGGRGGQQSKGVRVQGSFASQASGPGEPPCSVTARPRPLQHKGFGVVMGCDQAIPVTPHL